MTEKSPQRTVKLLIFHNSALHSGALIIHSEEWALASFLAKLSSSATGRNRNCGGAAGEGEVGTEISAHTVNMLTHQHAMDAEPRSALGCLVDPIWINSYHETVRDETVRMLGEDMATRILRGANNKINNWCRITVVVFCSLPFPRLNVELFHSLGNTGIKRLLYARAAFQYLCSVHRPVQGDNDAWATAYGVFNADFPSKPGVGESRNMP
ncbi:hypothetical protein EDB85DRAFT_2272481 [Lactarius pseudohatsudake]|nr:hypothetical protein EDB85DRAFT_2272481 [Lactarius pseudohatsudake]